MSLSVQHLTKLYGTQRAIDDVSFEARRGEIVGFLGPNGAGKSTTMKIATGYLAATTGDIQVAGHSVSEDPLSVRRAVGYLPEHNPLYLDMYVHEYLEFCASLHGIRGRQAKTRIGEVVQQTGLTREQKKQIGALSKGYRQRVGLAQALLHEPAVLILDEPTTGLDPNQLVEIREVIRQVGKDKTVVFSTHIMQEVEALCDRVVIIHQGRIVADKPLGDLRRKDESSLYLAFDQPVNNHDFLLDIQGVVSVLQPDPYTLTVLLKAPEDLRPAVFRAVAKSPYALVEFRREESSLENIFHNITR
jgi:ABC-2 type transport system ATP-binding protein